MSLSQNVPMTWVLVGASHLAYKLAMQDSALIAIAVGLVNSEFTRSLPGFDKCFADNQAL